MNDSGKVGLAVAATASEVVAATAEDQSAADATVNGGHLKYRPHLDGLRAVAVYLVVAFHAGLPGFSGGFIGVDVFFVLSGYLVTSILLRDVFAAGRIDWRRFYSRRARRILPAALVTLTITAVVYRVIASPSQVHDVLGSFRAAFIYVANWFFIHASTGYFVTTDNRNPVLHFWSLSVEEQFYLLWPLLLAVLYTVSRLAGSRRARVLQFMVLGLGVASAVQALHLAGTNQDRAYYGTDARAYQLLAGALLAVTPGLFQRGARHARAFQRAAFATLGLLLLVGTSVLSMGAITRGVVVVALVMALIISLEHTSGGTARGFLSSNRMVYLGKVSYGTYLWHWPVIVFVTYNRHVGSVALFAIAVLTATALAMLSFHVLEHPIRSSRRLDRYKTPIIVTGFALSLAGALIVAPAILDSGSPMVSGGITTRWLDPGVQLRNWRDAQDDHVPPASCYQQPIARCEVVHGTGLRIMLMGDSNARMWIPALTEIARRNSMSLSLAVEQGCPWQQGLAYANVTEGTRQICEKHRRDWYGRVLPRVKPDVLFLVHLGYDTTKDPVHVEDPNGQTLTPASPRFESVLQSLSARSLRILKPNAGKIVIVEPTPKAPSTLNPITCLSQHHNAAACRYATDPRPTRLETFYRRIASPPDLVTVDLDRVVCPRFPLCDPVIDNIIVKWDQSHITATYSRSRAAAIEDLLRRRGVLTTRK